MSFLPPLSYVSHLEQLTAPTARCGFLCVWRRGRGPLRVVSLELRRELQLKRGLLLVERGHGLLDGAVGAGEAPARHRRRGVHRGKGFRAELIGIRRVEREAALAVERGDEHAEALLGEVPIFSQMTEKRSFSSLRSFAEMDSVAAAVATGRLFLALPYIVRQCFQE